MGFHEQVTAPKVSTLGRGASEKRPLLFSGAVRVRTYVYVDGFNFYYGSVKGTPYRWLDFMALFKKILPSHLDILTIRYFTARVSGTPDDPDKPIRQQVFIRALERHIPEFEVHYGVFLRHVKKAPLAHPTPDRAFDYFIKTEEKGSDVNLAVHLLRDAWLNAYDCAVVVTNDSDLAEALKVVRGDFHKRIGLITPGRDRRPSRELLAHADFARRVREGALVASQLPDPIPGTNLHKPVSW